MKTIKYISAALLVSSMLVNAQNVSDGSISQANYKMPHKAKKAKILGIERANSGAYKLGSPAANNYKSAFNSVSAEGAAMIILPVETAGSSFAATGNYKNQFRSARPKAVVTPEEKSEPLARINE